MYITELETPAVLLDLDIAEKNLQTYQQACDKYEKSLWPMVKTHKQLSVKEANGIGCRRLFVRHH